MIDPGLTPFGFKAIGCIADAATLGCRDVGKFRLPVIAVMSPLTGNAGSAVTFISTDTGANPKAIQWNFASAGDVDSARWNPTSVAGSLDVRCKDAPGRVPSATALILLGSVFKPLNQPSLSF